MNTTTTISSISRQRPPKFMDFEALRAEGIKHLEELATFIWTDFNAHDPGITILEVLCYALTDLGYRVNFPFEDLMASESGSYEGLFHSPTESLSNSPITALDYRKLLIDVKGVRNAWLEKITSGGKYGEIDVFLDYLFAFREITGEVADELMEKVGFTDDSSNLTKGLIENLYNPSNANPGNPKNIEAIRQKSEALAFAIVREYGYFKKTYRALNEASANTILKKAKISTQAK